MLLLDDDDELPRLPSEREASLAAALGAAKLELIDLTLMRAARASWLKAARIVHDALEAGGFDVWDESYLHVHVRQLIRLVESGTLEAQGNLHRPRWSEVRLPEPR